ncbi:nucleotide disphospho-sugar-binding domain-containing protein [Mycolicibacterium sp. CBMA 361]|uniref:glycosyltransferase n=1 Tax=Mycolicibacterium sp. CBMA 361 TaxID=2606610 RepID=UPI0012DC49D3|nr:nucleotide disphospho-sugar-binding domain-containing protein [Mycolicibacterium sp. CBMA 361]MUM35829.1 glycosyl transferase [Mycolicibacterium sp. CBMA 361]
MRVAVVAGPDPGHAFPAMALCLRFLAAGDHPVLLTGRQWLDTAREAGVDARELLGLDPEEGDDDADSGAKIHERAARMAVLNVPVLRDLAPDLVVSDVITVCGGMAAELLGLPWVELTSAARVGIGLSAADPGPGRRLIATLPELEVPRPDWPAEAVVVGPLHFEPTTAVLDLPPGSGPVVVVAPSTATTGMQGLDELALEALIPGQTLPSGARVVVSRLRGPDGPVPQWAAVGLGRQDELLTHADVMICGSGHGIVSKTLLAGVPLVVVPGGGDQWEIANRVVRQGSGELIRPVTAESLTAAVDQVLSTPGYRAAAQRAGRSGADVADPVAVCRAALGVGAE